MTVSEARGLALHAMAWPEREVPNSWAGNVCDAFLSAMDGTRSHWGAFSKHWLERGVKTEYGKRHHRIVGIRCFLAGFGWRFENRGGCEGNETGSCPRGTPSWSSTEIHPARQSVACSTVIG